MNNLKKYGPGFIVLAAFLWAVDGILRRSLYTLPPSVIVFYEHLIGAALIAPFTFTAWQKERKQVTQKTWLALGWISLLSGVIGTLLFTAALIKVYFISFSVVYLLQKLQPIFAIAAARLLLKEKITSSYLGWAGLALVAAYFVTFKNGQVDFHTGSGVIYAALLAVGAAFAWGSSTAFSRFGLLQLSNTLMTGLRFFLTVPLALITVFLLRDQASLTTISSSQVLRLLLIALTTGMVALWIYYRGLKYTQVKVATILEFVFPLTAVLIDVIYYHNTLALSQYGAAIVLLYAAYRVAKLNQVEREV